MKYSMDSDEIFINIEPNKQDVDEVLLWLKEEKKTMELVFTTIKKL